MDKKTILVTGGTGYIGSHTCVELINHGYDVVIIDNLQNSKESVLDAIEKITGTRPKFHRVDLRDQEAVDRVLDRYNFDAVIHFAGLKAVAESVSKPILYYENNVGGTINLLQSMMRSEVKRLIFSSSACVYGIQENPEYYEDMQTGLGIVNPYGRTKFMIEEILKDLSVSDSEFEISILRYFNPIGNHQSGLIGEDPSDTPNNLMPIIMKVATGELEQLSIFGDDYPTPDGTAVRDYIHVVDLAQGHLVALSHLKPGYSVYNLGTGQGTSVLQMVDAFEKSAHSKIAKKIAPRRDGDLAIYFANASKAKRELEWQAKLTHVDAMKDTLSYLRTIGKLK